VGRDPWDRRHVLLKGYTYLYFMKREKPAKAKPNSKLTLSVEPEYVAMLRRASARRGRSITELVQELALRLDKEAEEGKELWADRTNGMLAGAFREEDYERQDLLGALLRKHLPEGGRNK
jgi:hypothetical protein